MKNIILFLIAIILISFNIEKPFVGHHDYNNAFYGNMARNLVRYGPIATKLGQVTNSGIVPVSDFTFHTHHPPLLIWLLALSYYLFGVSELATRVVPIIFSAMTVLMFYLLARKIFNEKTALVAVLCWMITPIFIYFGKMAVHEILVLFFFVWSFYLYTNGNKKLLFLSVILGCLSGWPGFYISIMIAIYDLFKTRKINFAFLIPLAFIPVFIFILLLINNVILTGNAFGGGLLNAYFFRTGSVPLFDYVRKEIAWIFAYYSKPLVVFALIGLVSRKPILYIFGLYGLTYLILFKSAAYRHDYLIYYFLPFISLGAAYCLQRFNKYIIFGILTASLVSSFAFTRALLVSNYMEDGYIAGKLINNQVKATESVLVSDSDIYTNGDWTTLFYGDREISIVHTGEKNVGYDWLLTKDNSGKIILSK